MEDFHRKMTAIWKAVKRFFESQLRPICLIIGYWHLIASLFSILLHVIIVYILTNGFQCEISKDTLRAVQWRWHEPVLLIINFGAHGFFSFPLIFNYHFTSSVKYLPLPERNPPCYRGITHLQPTDMIYFVVNIIWLNFVMSFISAVHKKDPGPIITFFLVTIIKLVCQLSSFFAQASYNDAILDIFYKIIDVCFIIIFLIIIKKYFKELRNDKNRQYPPGLFESIYDRLKSREEKKGTFNILEEKTTEKLDVEIY